LRNLRTKTAASQKDKVQLNPIPLIGEFAQEWVCDVWGPTLKPTARRRNKHILVCVDQATRFTQLFALRNLQAQTLTDVFVNQLFARFGVPKSLVYDQQSALTSVLFQNVLKEMHVESKIAHTAYHTRTGLAERHVRTVSDTLKAYIHDSDYSKNWDTTLNYIV